MSGSKKDTNNSSKDSDNKKDNSNAGFFAKVAMFGAAGAVYHYATSEKTPTKKPK